MRSCGFCNAKRNPCILCAAQLNSLCEAGDCIAGFAALLGRFLPRLGPFGSPSGPFSFHNRKQSFPLNFGTCASQLVAMASQVLDLPPTAAALGNVHRHRQENIATQYNCYSAAARRSSNTGRASNTRADISASVRISFGKSLLLERVASSR